MFLVVGFKFNKNVNSPGVSFCFLCRSIKLAGHEGPMTARLCYVEIGQEKSSISPNLKISVLFFEFEYISKQQLHHQGAKKDMIDQSDYIT